VSVILHNSSMRFADHSCCAIHDGAIVGVTGGAVGDLVGDMVQIILMRSFAHSHSGLLMWFAQS